MNSANLWSAFTVVKYLGIFLAKVGIIESDVLHESHDKEAIMMEQRKIGRDKIGERKVVHILQSVTISLWGRTQQRKRTRRARNVRSCGCTVVAFGRAVPVGGVGGVMDIEAAG